VIILDSALAASPQGSPKRRCVSVGNSRLCHTPKSDALTWSLALACPWGIDIGDKEVRHAPSADECVGRHKGGVARPCHSVLEIPFGAALLPDKVLTICNFGTAALGYVVQVRVDTPSLLFDRVFVSDARPRCRGGPCIQGLSNRGAC